MHAFSTAFRLLRADTLPDSGPHAVLGVRAVARAANGWALVDSRSKRVTVRNARWQVIRQLGRGGQGPGEYESPVDVRVARDGSILVLDKELIRVNVYGASGRVVRTMSPIPANTRRLGVIGDSLILAYGVVPGAKSSSLVTGLAWNARERWRAVEADPLLAATRLIYDDVWGVEDGNGTALLGASISPHISRIDARTGSVQCRSRIPAALWLSLDPQQRPTTGGLPALQKWIEKSSAVSSAVMVDGQLLLAMDRMDGSGREMQQYVMFDRMLSVSAVLRDVPGRLVFARGDTVWATRESDDGAVLVTSFLRNH